MNICYALNEGYVDYCSVSIVSLLENNRDSDVVFHILTDRLSDSAETKLRDIIRPYGAEMHFYAMDDSRLRGQKTSWSKYGWYRIFASELLPKNIDKLLYLDCDTIVTGNISELFDISENDWSIAAVPDYMTICPELYERIGYDAEKGYFCSGVLLMNLDYFRKYDLPKVILEYAINNPNKIHFPDQDALNCVCCDSKRFLPIKYGILDPFYRDPSFISAFKDEIAESLVDPKIIHFAGCAPWIFESDHHYFEDEFWKYASLIGDIPKIHYCNGISLRILQAKKLIGEILRIPKYKQLQSKPRPAYQNIIKMLNA